MFGCFRYLLALLAVVGHVQHAHAWAAHDAVFGFYTLSGFLMSRILHETYGLHSRGIARYFVNRALRLYPAYWCAVAPSGGLPWLFLTE